MPLPSPTVYPSGSLFPDGSWEQIVLDPAEVAEDRVEVSLNSGPFKIRLEGINWGNAEIQTYMAEQARGSSPVDFRIPNRTIEIPLIIQADDDYSFNEARCLLQNKVARIQQEGGWLKRALGYGVGGMYCDIVNASLNFSGGWLQANEETDIDAMLVLEAIPDFYGDEEELDDHTETSAAELVFTETAIKGDYPGRVRIVVDDDSGQNQRGLIWAFRSRHYSSLSTARLAYEAEALQTLDTAAKVAKVGASGGTVVTHPTLSTNWTPVVGTNIAGSTFLTHTGTNRIFARVFTTSGTAVQSRFVWDVGDLVYPVENPAVRCYDGGTFHILDLGEARLDPTRWQGQVQAKGDVGAENFSVDRVWIVNADEGMGVLRAPIAAPEGLVTYSARSDFNTESGAITGDSLVVGGTWTGAGDADDFTVSSSTATRTAVSDSTDTGRFITASTPSLAACVVRVDFQVSAVPSSSSARISVLARYADASNYLAGEVVYGALVTPYLTIRGRVSGSFTVSVGSYPLPTQLAAGGWYSLALLTDAGGRAAGWLVPRGNPLGAPQVTGQHTALATGGSLAGGKVGILDEYLSATASTRSYKSFAAWVPADDAVVFASRSAELATPAITRLDTGGTAYGPVSDVTGDLPRIPPAGLEGRTTEVFVKASRGDIQTLTDPAIDDLSARVYYRPSWLLVPES